MIEIEVCERVMDSWVDHNGIRQPRYHAQIKGNPGQWACGQDRDGAIGNLIRNNPAAFGIAIECLGKLPR